MNLQGAVAPQLLSTNPFPCIIKISNLTYESIIQVICTLLSFVSVIQLMTIVEEKTKDIELWGIEEKTKDRGMGYN